MTPMIPRVKFSNLNLVNSASDAATTFAFD